MGTRILGHLAGALLAGTLAVAPLPTGATVVISDQTFNTADWTTTVGFASGSATQAVHQELTGGSGGSYLWMQHVLPGAGSISVLHMYNAVSYDPATQGAIASIDYSESRIELAPLAFPGAAIGALFMLQQGAGLWYCGGDLSFANTTWTTLSLTGLTASNCSPSGAVGLPDFSSSGAPLTFGVLRSNTNSTTTGASITTLNGLDNWSVTIHQVPTNGVPEPGTLALLGLGLAGLGLTRRRKEN